MVNNPISLVSRWKILDNLRRSLVEPATALLLIAGWFFLPGRTPLLDACHACVCSSCLSTSGLFSRPSSAAVKKDWDLCPGVVHDFLTSHVSIFLNIAFLAHQALVSLDAIVRTIVRSTITHSQLLEWETATEAELGLKSGPR